MISCLPVMVKFKDSPLNAPGIVENKKSRVIIAENIIEYSFKKETKLFLLIIVFWFLIR